MSVIGDDKNKKSQQHKISTRISNRDYKWLENQANQNESSISALTGNIIHWYVSKLALKTNTDIHINKEILGLFLDSCSFMRNDMNNNNEYSQIVKRNIEKAAMFILSEWRMQMGQVDFAEFKKRITEWHKLNHMQVKFFNSDSNHHSSKITIMHNLGILWSEFQCRLYCKMLEKIKNVTVVSSEFDELNCIIDVARPKEYKN